MSESEQAIRDLEEAFPTLAGRAFAAAREEALRAGLSVWESDGKGVAFELFPDGTRIERKRIDPPTRVAVGTVVKLR